MLDLAIDPEPRGAAAADPQHEGLAGDRDLEVAVRDSPAERLDPIDAAGPDTAGKLVRAHERMRVPAGSNSGSAATSPAIHSPKISTSTGVPAVAAAAGR